MKIGVPRERKEGERRVAITPDGVRILKNEGHNVLIEANAGVLSGFSDKDYSSSGAVLVERLEDLWEKSDLVVKVKEPVPEEVELFRPGLGVFCFLHLAVFPELTRALCKSEVIGLDYDLLKLPNGRLPILEPMSVVAGKLAIQCGVNAMLASNNGSGILPGGAVGVKPAKVVIIGGGAAGSAAAYVAAGMGAEVIVFDISYDKLSEIHFSNNSIKSLFSTAPAIEKEISDADLIVGSVLIPGALAPKLIKRDYLKLMKTDSVIVDVCIDQGGVAESSRPTSISNPTYVEEGVIHYCVPNMPALVPQTSTIALTNETIGWVKIIANNGLEKSISLFEPLKESVVSFNGNVTNEEIAKAHKLNFVSV